MLIPQFKTSTLQVKKVDKKLISSLPKEAQLTVSIVNSKPQVTEKFLQMLELSFQEPALKIRVNVNRQSFSSSVEFYINDVLIALNSCPIKEGEAISANLEKNGQITSNMESLETLYHSTLQDDSNSVKFGVVEDEVIKEEKEGQSNSAEPKLPEMAQSKIAAMARGNISRKTHDVQVFRICHAALNQMKKIILNSGTANVITKQENIECSEFLDEVSDEYGIGKLKKCIDKGFANCESQAWILWSLLVNNHQLLSMQNQVHVASFKGMDHAFVVICPTGRLDHTAIVADSWMQHLKDKRQRGFLGTLDEYKQFCAENADGRYIQKNKELKAEKLLTTYMTLSLADSQEICAHIIGDKSLAML